MKQFIHLILYTLLTFCGGADAFSKSCTDLLLTDRPRARTGPNSETYYYWSSAPESNFFIEGHLVGGVLEYGIKLKNFHSSGRSEHRGQDLFHDMVMHFGLKNIEAIRGKWSEGDNFTEFFNNLEDMSEERAAKNTWSGRMASNYGFTSVEVVDYSVLVFEKGKYAEVIFRRPSYDLRLFLAKLKSAWSMDYWDE